MARMRDLNKTQIERVLADNGINGYVVLLDGIPGNDPFGCEPEPAQVPTILKHVSGLIAREWCWEIELASEEDHEKWSQWAGKNYFRYGGVFGPKGITVFPSHF